MIIKYSKKLNVLLDKILSIEDYDDSLGDLLARAEKSCTEDSNDYRTVDYAEYVDAGIDMVIKSQKTNKPIYCVYSNSHNSVYDIILYFVDDLGSLQDFFKSLLKRREDALKKETEELEEEQIEILEKRLSLLKKKQRKK